jgi:thymidine phosphorylase
MRLGAGRVKKGASIDSAVGIVLQRAAGDTVRAGDALAAVHASNAAAAAAAAGEVAAAYTIVGGAAPAAPLVRAVVQ